MNTDNWRGEHADDPIDKLLSQVTILDMFIAHIEMHDATKWYKGEYLGNRESDKKLANLLNDLVSATLKEKDKEIASLRAELEGLKEQIPRLLKEQRELCADNAKVKRTDMMGDARCYTDKDSILSAPSPQIKQP